MKDFNQLNRSFVVYKLHELQQKVYKRILQESDFANKFNEKQHIMKIRLKSEENISKT